MARHGNWTSAYTGSSRAGNLNSSAFLCAPLRLIIPFTQAKYAIKKAAGEFKPFGLISPAVFISAKLQSLHWQRFDGSSPLSKARIIASLVISSVLAPVIAEPDCDNNSPKVEFLQIVTPLLGCMGAKFMP